MAGSGQPGGCLCQDGQPYARRDPSRKKDDREEACPCITGDTRGHLYFEVTGVGVLRYDTMNDFWSCYNQEQGHLLTNEPFRAAVTPLGKLLVTSVRESPCSI